MVLETTMRKLNNDFLTYIICQVCVSPVGLINSFSIHCEFTAGGVLCSGLNQQIVKVVTITIIECYVFKYFKGVFLVK